MQHTELMSQEGMERSLTKFTRRYAEDFPGTINAGLCPHLESCCFADKTAIISYDTQPWMSNPGGVVHGGMVATLFDVAIGCVTYFAAGEKLTPTMSLQVSFVRPMAIGKRVYVQVSLTSCGRTSGHATAKAWQEGEPDRIIATAAGLYYTAG
jgi:uncharacterized protein (TIGR00369 family)